MSLVLDAFAESWDNAGMTVSNQRLFRETELRPITSIVSVPTAAIWACGAIPRNRSCLSACFRKE